MRTTSSSTAIRRRAQFIRRELEKRLAACRLELHPEKTKIVYCRDSNRLRDYPQIAFDFLGFTFRPRTAVNRRGGFFVSFSPAVSRKAAKEIVSVVRRWKIHKMSDKSLEDLSRMFDRAIRGWVNYYGGSTSPPCILFSPASTDGWCDGRKKYKRYQHQRRATHWLRGLARRQPGLFAHWALGALP